VDLEEEYEVYAILVWRYHSEARIYHDCVVQLSNDPDFVTDVTTVFNNDYDNSAGLGVGKDYEYIETNEGRLIDCRGAKSQYVRLYSDGNTSNDMNHYIEVEVYGRPVGREPVPAQPRHRQEALKPNEGATITGRMLNADSEPLIGWLVVAEGLPAYTIVRTGLNGEYELTGLARGDYTVLVVHPTDGTRHRVLSTSANGRERVDLGERTVAGIMGGHEDMYELALDLPRPMFRGPPRQITSKRLDPATGTRRTPFWVPGGTRNLALGKGVAASDEAPILGELPMATDGDKEGYEGRFVELGPGLQWVQVDLGQEREIFAIVVWHYHAQKRIYYDRVVQLSNDPDFLTDVTTVFNNDYDNSAGLGVGKDYEYIETNEGRLIDCGGAKSQYVRLYSDGNSSNDMNHYTEVEVYGRPVGYAP